MRAKLPDKVESGRYTTGPYASPHGAVWGMFEVMGPCATPLRIVASDAADGEVWEHVSISTQRRCPNWEEMSAVKDWFWDDEECVAQFHPPKSQWVNNHPHCLHLWRNPQRPFELPPAIMVGVKSAGVLDAKQAAELRKQHGL